jgi:hypothetical protein
MRSRKLVAMVSAATAFALDLIAPRSRHAVTEAPNHR